MYVCLYERTWKGTGSKRNGNTASPDEADLIPWRFKCNQGGPALTTHFG